MALWPWRLGAKELEDRVHIAHRVLLRVRLKKRNSLVGGDVNCAQQTGDTDTVAVLALTSKQVQELGGVQ